jgi:hypothetical protein
LYHPYGLFVATQGDIYVDNGYNNHRVEKWTINSNTSTPAMYVSQQCYGLFVDINRTLYCSMTDHHQVVAKSLDSDSSTFSIVIGTGCPGSASNMLYNPRGIFVDINFDLYVADCRNNRIQLFQLGQTIGSTVAGGVSGTITLNCPTDVVLDADNNLFIVDSNNHRIIGSGPNGFRCLLGCFETGSGRNQLAYPQSMAFDSYGNIFITDASNNRIQKFVFSENPCSKYDYI